MTSTHLHGGFDHVGYYTEDLDNAFARFTALGFTVAPPSHFADQAFTTLAIAIGDAYFSVSGVTDWQGAPEWMRAGMGKGLQAFVLRGHDLESIYAQIGPDGDGTLQLDGQVNTIAREISIDGLDSHVRFKVLRLKRGSLPGLARCNYCEHLTPELIWRPEMVSHANGARAIRMITAVHENPAQAAGFYERLFGNATITPKGDLLTDVGRSQLRLVTPERLEQIWPGLSAPYVPGEPLLAGMTIAVADLDEAKHLLSHSGIAAVPTPDGGIAVAAADAYGAVIEFTSL